MIKTLRNITEEMYNLDLDYVNIKKGNYRVKRTSNNIFHYYYGNVICVVDLNTKKFGLHNCGYVKYTLTTAQLNWLENFYISKGYKLIYRGF